MYNNIFALKFLAAILLFNYYCLLLASAIPKSNITDESSLLAFKSHITSDPFGFLTTNWSTAASVCRWVGVTCNARHGRVVALDLSNMGLKGTISPHIGNLSFLALINLANNSFYGFLPNEIFHLRRLISIDIRSNSISRAFSSSFSNLTKLQYLILKENNLTGTIHPSLYTMPSLKVLDLSVNNIGGVISEEIGNLTNLQYLNLDFNQLNGFIPSRLFNVSSLETIGLQSNGFSGHLRVETCSDASNLHVLILHNNRLDGELPSNLQGCRELQKIGFVSNMFTGKIPTEFGNLTELRYLQLSLNHLRGEIPKEVGNLTRLEEFSAVENYLQGKIPSEIGQLTGLRNLDLQENKLSGTIPTEIGHLRNLQHLRLSMNQLGGSFPSFTNFTMMKLKKLDFNANNLFGTLPSQISSWFPALEEIYLAVNAFTGPIPRSFSNISSLTLLELSYNNLSGFVPHFLGMLRNLRVLDLDVNLLYASDDELSFFSSLTNCEKLELLSIEKNMLKGRLPASIGNFSASMREVYLSNNDFEGSIPEEIGNLTNLLRLELLGNNFTGSIPTTIRKLHNLQGLFLNYNSLQGRIPVELCGLKKLTDLRLSQNMLSGSIPACWDNLTSLRRLLLGSNKLTSSIPSSFWSLQYILQVDFSRNSLTGFLPIEVQKLKVAVHIDLSRNRLSGRIPSSISSLQNLVNLSLSYNLFHGSIPESIGAIVSLERLELSNNQLSGVIPKSLEKLLYLKFLDLSYNQLEGEIPGGGPFANFSIQSFRGNLRLCSFNRALKVQRCKSATKQHPLKHMLYWILPIFGLMFLVVVSLIIYLTFHGRHKKQQGQDDLIRLPTWRRVSQHELLQATNGFHESNLLGAGSFGSVYRGTLSDGAIVAIKVFNLQLEEAYKSFVTECDVLSHLRHRNLVKVLTSCSNPNFKALLFDFVTNGNLEKWLHSSTHYLNFQQRVNTAIDIASGLEYLHDGYTQTVVHCDLKPSNVLIDEEMVAYVADFGIAKLLGIDAVTQTLTLATIGYMAPGISFTFNHLNFTSFGSEIRDDYANAEYGSEGFISEKTDVYSYGVILMELFTRKRPTDEMFNGGVSLKQWVQESMSHNALLQIIDADLTIMEDQRKVVAMEGCVLSIMNWALKCCAASPKERPNMKDVVADLNKIRSNFLKQARRFRYY